jgi:hypothetical protein
VENREKVFSLKGVLITDISRQRCSRSMQHTIHAKTIVRYLQKRGAWVARIRGTWGQRKGLPDILACWQGRLIAIEVKTGKGRLTPEQRREHEALRAAGAVVIVGDAVQVVQELERLTQEPQARLAL